MPYVNVTLNTGQTLEAKQALMAAVTDAIHETIGSPMDSVRVWLTEVPPEQMTIGGVPVDVVRARRDANGSS